MRALFGLALCVSLLGCPPPAPSTPPAPKTELWQNGTVVPPGTLPVIKELPEFTLMERGGGTVGRADLLGQIWVADFIFTRCQGPCPVMSKQMAGLQGRLSPERFPRLRFVSISVDPANDTPEILSKYADEYGADPKRWLFLTGEQSAIHELVGKDGFLLPVGPLDAEGLVTHSTKFVLVDHEGRIRAFFDGTARADMERLEEAIVQLGVEQALSGPKRSLDAP